jgi:tetraacyldisaccharide 4'-kinase
MGNSSMKIYRWLYPASWIYGCGVWLRNCLFDHGILHERSFELPVICVGNLTVGGTGKTPHTEYLIRLLKKEYKVAVLSRGYKRKSKGFVLAGEQSTVEQLGDEPYQMKRKFPDIHVAVDADRCHGIEQLTNHHVAFGTEVILLDDAYQHRYVKAGLNILLVDYNRLITEDALLPAGRLREPQHEKQRAHIVIITKCPADLSPLDLRMLGRQMDLYPYQHLYFTTLVYGKLRQLDGGDRQYALTQIQRSVHILLVTGIANPAPLEEDLAAYNDHITPLAFGDHHAFTAGDLKIIRDRFMALPEGRRMIITTEKDAARLASHPALPDDIRTFILVLPVEVKFLQDQQELFNLNITEYVRKNPRNSMLSQRENAYES